MRLYLPSFDPSAPLSEARPAPAAAVKRMKGLPLRVHGQTLEADMPPDLLLLLEQASTPGARLRVEVGWQTAGESALPLACPTQRH